MPQRWAHITPSKMSADTANYSSEYASEEGKIMPILEGCEMAISEYF